MAKYRSKTPILFLFILLSSVFLAGCLNANSTVNDIHALLESVVELEQEFENQQDPLVELEKEEKEIYSKIISLGMKEFDQIVALSNEASAIVAKRQEHMDKEATSIEASKKEFEKIEPLIEKIEDVELKKKANELKSTMLERYETHGTLYENYMNGLTYDKELYEMFQKEDLSIDQLEEQIEKINNSYKLVLESNKEFNELTQQYNEIKFDLYNIAGLEITEENN